MADYQELVYGPDDLRDLIAERFPDARITDASDAIHRERFQVSGVDYEEFRRFAYERGFPGNCLGLRLRAIATQPKGTEKPHG